ncbi:MAG: PD40 domain-containing protein [Thermoleophilaceae bacterium]
MRLKVLGTAAVALAATAAIASAHSTSAVFHAGTRTFSTQLISRALDGGLPNAPSTNAVISDDKRFARVIAYQSQATNIVRDRTNGQSNIYLVKRLGSIGNTGLPWEVGATSLISRTPSGEPANGPSFLPAVDGAFHHKPSCVAFLSGASNLVPGDTNGKVDAFVSRGLGGLPQRVSLLPGGAQPTDDVTAVAVSGDCSRIAFVTGGRLYVRLKRRTVAIAAPGAVTHPAFSTGLRNDLVFASTGGAYLSKNGTARPRLVAPGGTNPVYNDLKRQVVAYEKPVGNHVQVAYRDLNGPEHIVSQYHGESGNGDSHSPVIGNSGYYISFQSSASNLGEGSPRQRLETRGATASYLYTDVRKLTLIESAWADGDPLPGGGENPSMSYYANYIVFDSPSPFGSASGPHQVHMRYLGGV